MKNDDEFPIDASLWPDHLDRREFLKLLSSSLALAGLTACSPPQEKIVPYIKEPENMIPGKSLFYSTAMTVGGYATGVLVKSYMGRPIKIEGNPDHPASLGATDPFTQASLLDLYNPDRGKNVINQGQPSHWENFLKMLGPHFDLLRKNQGRGLRILTENISSPTLIFQLKELLRQLPQAQWIQYEPLQRDQVWKGTYNSFNQILEPIYRFDQADIVLCLDADFLSFLPGHLNYARQFTQRKKTSLLEKQTNLNRLYSIEPTPSLTGCMADEKLAMSAEFILPITIYLMQELGINIQQKLNHEEYQQFLSFKEYIDQSHHSQLQFKNAKIFLKHLSQDLLKHRGRSLVIVGDQQPAIVHQLSYFINDHLNNLNKTLYFTHSLFHHNPTFLNKTDSLQSLITDMENGHARTLLILGGNPAYNAPINYQFDQLMLKVPIKIMLSSYENETTKLCDWYLPQSHYLESWGDARAFNGTCSLIQPLIAPLYDTKTIHEIIHLIAGLGPKTCYEIIQSYWQAQRNLKNKELDHFFATSLQKGIIPQTSFAMLSRLPQPQVNFDQIKIPKIEALQQIEIIFTPDYSVYDGRFIHNAWLNELPRPFSKITWDNVALISPQLAEKYQLINGNFIEIQADHYQLSIPVWIMPGQYEYSLTLPLGYGQKYLKRLGSKIGFNTYQLRSSSNLYRLKNITFTKGNKNYPLASTQGHFLLEGRNIIQSDIYQSFLKASVVDQPAHHHHDLSLFPDVINENQSDHAWGMVIDLNSCIGCNSCVVACQAENNIPIVGKEQVILGREMHWLRIDHYYEGPAESPQHFLQPMLCMHCEKAPCEVVCPVMATLHGSDGLNEMVYNRCVGTRYCANNCPYKVRRFNFLQYSENHPTLNMMRNPHVTVRSRGVMEKCTYCVQRINHARIEAKKDNRGILDGELQTSCQAACPTQAIIFGDLKDKNSQVSRYKESPLNYAVLAELGTRPRTTYLKKIINPYEEL